ncbi:UNKNOWN [Stylonychia lemnae]|uniref:TLDc domain-containing protein n=1 Tax=Stylonychia lemnae TaxID=5949 RepID=A0A078AZD8_STYLE|nr:UNKNOWN [Stylonychia lemnae]|eukprot:CDW87805.1 UNKNOWN [Stylonychia lemnae]
MISKSLFSALFLVSSTLAIQLSDVLQKSRVQLQWKQEATNKFSWNATQELKWSVANAFIDVQTSPDGDVYAIQNISSEMSQPKYHIYMYDITTNVWNLTDPAFQAKAIRFDRLGSKFYLTPENCVLNNQKQTLLCGVSDFEVTVDKKIYGLIDNSGRQQADTLSSSIWKTASNDSSYTYKALAGYKGITLLKDQPILINQDGRVDAQYGSEKLISISAGIDGSLWALLDEINVTDYTVLKWQTVSQKWYKITGVSGVSLSSYNEISVAIVDSKGLLSLSSQVGHQDEAAYVVETAPPTIAPSTTQSQTTIPQTTIAPTTIAPTTNPPTTTVPTTVPPLPIVLSQPSNSILTHSDFKWLQTAVTGKNFTEFSLLFSATKNTKSLAEAVNTILGKSDVFVLMRTNTSVVIGFYYKTAIAQASDNYLSSNNELTALLSVTKQLRFMGITDQNRHFGLFNNNRYILLNDQGGMTFGLNCYVDSTIDMTLGKDRVRQYKNVSGNALYEPNNQLSNNSDINNDFVECQQIEIYQAKQ